LAQKQATLDELSSKYNALLVQKSAHPHNMAAENSRLMRENERVVPTFTSKKDLEELDLSSMTEEELKMLQKKGKQSRRLVAAHILFSFLDSDDPLSQFCSLLLISSFYETDPFLYYSIPAVREAALSLSMKLTTLRYRSQRVSYTQDASFIREYGPYSG
jgi:hypothetical protein